VWTAADLAWEKGDYPAALRGMQALLDGADSLAYLERVALRTGELHRTTELTTDGARPAFSPDGAMVSWESGIGGARVTRIARTATPATIIAQLPGGSAAIAPGNGVVAWLPPAELGRGTVAVRDLATGRDLRVTGLDGWVPSGVTFGLDAGTLFVTAAATGETTRNEILRVTRQGGGYAVQGPIANADGFKHNPVVLPGGRYLLHQAPVGNPVRLPTGAAGFRVAQGFAIVDLTTGAVRRVDGAAPTVSANGARVAWVEREGGAERLLTMPVAGGDPREVVRTTERIDAPALSPDGAWIAYQRMPQTDWELYLIGTDGEGGRRLTHEIQHDLWPQWLDDASLIAVMGEARHRRVHHYDLTTGMRTKLFHNNTVRTIAPEYEWVASADGTTLLIVAERDGNTVSPERGVYLMELATRVTPATMRARLAGSLADELALRERGLATFRPIAEAVRAVTAMVEVPNVFRYSRDLFAFESKHISQPGNARAIAYLDSTYRSFGLEVRRQYFSPRGALGDSTANVLAILPGTTHPELVYIVSSHFDSRAEGPGADDNTSGTAALLEAARVMAQHPQAATIIFASFTGEESGLLGSREWVRQAVRDSVRLVGALNNDMIGFANDHRLDNTIRYSNPGIRDIQHAAAMQFSDLITYDALYYKSTDAAAYYEAWGDIVGGIGSYPVLGNPHYHQPHDVLETINHQLVAEVSKTTVATLMLLASSPSRVAGLTATAGPGGEVALTWLPSPERDVTGYLVSWGPADAPGQWTRRVSTPTTRLTEVAPGMVARVKALNAKGLDGWDWAVVPLTP
jgi:sugar lactone lactonase YvrE